MVLFNFVLVLLVSSVVTYILLEHPAVRLAPRTTWWGYTFRGIVFPLLVLTVATLGLQLLLHPQKLSVDHFKGMFYGACLVAVGWPMIYHRTCRRLAREEAARQTREDEKTVRANLKEIFPSPQN